MTTPNVKILIVDDDRHLLDLLIETLSTIGYEISGASGSEDALEFLDKDTFDILITDIKMPEMDGLMLSNKVRQLYPDLPILLITGVDEPEIIGRAEHDGFLAKPFRINHIEEMIENTINNIKDKINRNIKTVLIVDDDHSFRNMLTDLLKSSGFTPIPAENGEQALNEINTNSSIDAVISDIKMPGMNGLTLLKEIKKINSDLPVILVTAFFSDSNFKDHIYESTASGFLEKPFKITTIVDMLKNLSPINSQ